MVIFGPSAIPDGQNLLALFCATVFCYWVTCPAESTLGAYVR